MIHPAHREATYQDVLDAPEHLTAQVIDGELVLQPRPARPHTKTSSLLGAQLIVAYNLGISGPGGWWILNEPEVHFGAQILVPDIAGWLRSEVGELDKDLAYYDEVPAWVCEVLSPGTMRVDRIKKLRIYREAGVKHVWLVHPTDHTIEVFESSESGWVLIQTHEGEGAFAAKPFEALELDTSTLWLQTK